ncbi:MAG TPA: alpha/beta hydrolase [Herpetosiphonaceae bacterium]|nr:alpha/beta hydrolase [Herpetosiphonaceae bacterium]
MNEVRLSDGSIRYRDQGSGTPIVFLHGALSNANTWRKVLALMPEGYRCIAPDLPLGGHALPFGRGADLTPDGIARLLAEFFAALGLEEAVLVGNDTGGAYAQVFAAAYPEKVSRLVLCNCDALETFPPKNFSSLQRGIRVPGYTFLMAQLFRYKPFLKSAQVLGLLSHALSKEEIADLYVRGFVRDRRVRDDFKKVVKGWSPRATQRAAAALARFPKPAVIIWGADDERLFPRDLGERLWAVFPQARFEVVESALTYVQEDQPERFVQALLVG